jgi:hypothetical protein
MPGWWESGVVVQWWVVLVLVLVSRREGDWWWWEVVESVSVGWQSARARECCGLWEETGGGSDGQGRALGEAGASKPDSETASKPASKAVCQGVEEKEAGDKSR